MSCMNSRKSDDVMNNLVSNCCDLRDETAGHSTTFADSTVMNYAIIAIIAAGTGLTVMFDGAALIAGAITIPVALVIVAACVLTAMAYWHPLVSVYANTMLWVAACLVPLLTHGVNLMAIPVAIASMLAACHHTRHSGIAVTVQLLAWTAGVGIGVLSPPDTPLAAGVLLVLPAAPVAGLLMAWKQRLDRAQAAERELQQRRIAMREQERRATAATRIHDRITNRLAYLILRMDNDQAQWHDSQPDCVAVRTELADLSGVVQDVLDETRDVIGILNGYRSVGNTADAAESSADNVDDTAAGDPAGETAMIRDHLAEVSRRLEALGFTADTSLDGMLPQQYRIASVNALHDLIDEIGTNIAKHAQPHTACELHIDFEGVYATVTSHNSVRSFSGMQEERAERCGTMGMGMGLRSKTALIHDLGGSIHHTTSGGVWRIQVRLPCA